MPTGYTAPVSDGEITELSEFAALCARGFMPFIHMRDESMEAPLRMPSSPENSYTARRLKEVKDEWEDWQNSDEDSRYAQWSEYVRDITERVDDAIASKTQVKERYLKMLVKVNSIEVPAELQTFKNYLIAQLKDSIGYDCNTSYLSYKTKSYPEWCEDMNVTLQEAVTYYERANEQEWERYNERCKLIRLYEEAFGFEVLPARSEGGE